MDHESLLKFQLQTSEKTRLVYPQLTGTWPNVIDLFFRMPYFRNDSFDHDTPEEHYNYWCFERFFRLPYTLQSVYEQWEFGEYLEATLLVRHLLETFVQVRYFLFNKEKLIKHQKSTHARDRIKFKTMFDALSPGLYKETYGLFSIFAHGGLGAGLFSFDMVAAGNEVDRPRMQARSGCQFSEKHSSLIINQVLALIYGFANYFPKCFPSYRQSVDEKTESNRLEMLGSVDNWMKGHATDHPQTREWHKLMDKLVR
jgi:hypothetical protein